MKSTPERRAQDVFDMIKLLAVGLWEPCAKLKPHLWEAVAERGKAPLTLDEKCFKWDFLHIVAMTWWAVNLAKVTLPPAEFKIVARSLEQQVGEWNPGAIAGFSDLNNFVRMYDSEFQKLTDLSEVIDFTKLVVGTWLLWNLTNKAKFSDEAELAGMLGHTVYSSVAGCWEGTI
jgi:hypothetical protein